MKLRNSEKCAIIITLVFLALVLGYHLGTDRQEAGFTVTEYKASKNFGDETGLGSSAEPTEESAEKVNINTASSEELQTLHGIGPVLAQRIIDYREANGGFEKIEEITSVSGISVKTYEAVKDYITVE